MHLQVFVGVLLVNVEVISVEGGSDGRVRLGAGLRQPKGVTLKPVYCENKGGTFTNQRELAADWRLPCRGHTHTGSALVLTCELNPDSIQVNYNCIYTLI